MPKDFAVNGSSVETFEVINNGNTTDSKVNISKSNPDAIFLMQGSWTFLADHGTFCGKTLSGILVGGDWVDFASEAVVGSQLSRIPQDIECFAIQGPSSASSYGALYDNTPPDNAQYPIVGDISDFSNWQQYAGTNGNDLPATACDDIFEIE